MKNRVVAFCAVALVVSSRVHGDYADVMDFFDFRNATTTFPVVGRGLADIESAFGPRIQTSGGNYDWHRGIDIDIYGESVDLTVGMVPEPSTAGMAAIAAAALAARFRRRRSPRVTSCGRGGEIAGGRP